MDFISVSEVAKVEDWLRLLIEMLNWPPSITAPVKIGIAYWPCWLSAAELAEWTVVVEHSETWDELDFCTFCWVSYLVFSFSWSSANCSTELMSANLEAMILGKQRTLPTWPPRKAGKTDTNFLTFEKNRSWLLIGRRIFFTSEKNRRTDEIASLQRETVFIRGVCTE